MISPKCDLRQFIEAIQTRDYLDVIGLADKEATEAERLRFRMRGESPKNGSCSRYPELIKELIQYLRYGVRTSLVRQEDVEVFRALREQLLDREPTEETEIN
ncbi:MAG: hypothetical protein C4576_10700 [Desulfobacteraceae bacterium]|jgi:hypothetical protein|nr:MAG: hypothetical protein C4576_10700 [Desulfobacteraceae bacterium]